MSINKNYVMAGMLATAVAIPLSDTTTSHASEIRTTTVRVHFRTGAGTNYSSMDILDKGVKVKAIEKSSDGKWLKINYNSQNVWVNFAYLQKDKSSNNDIKLDSQYETTANVNMRKGPSTDYTKIIIVPAQTKITPIKSSSDGKWVQINYKNVTGWISAQYIKTVSTTPTPTQPNKVEVGKKYKTTEYVRARKGPGTSYDVATVLAKGTQVVPVEILKSGYWAMFKYNNQYMYVCTDYLEADNQSATPTEPEKPINGKDYYTTANLNIRDGASTTSSKIGKIPNGTKVSVVDFNSNKTWAKVVYNNKTGWVSAQYLSTKSQEPEQKEDTYWTGTTTQNLNMRKGPSTDYSIIITIPKNSDVKIYETKSGWAKIKYKSYEGYCSASFIK